MTKKTIALATLVMLGLASGAMAGSKDDPDMGGGYRVGPLGQSATSGVNPVYHRSLQGRAGENATHQSYEPAR